MRMMALALLGTVLAGACQPASTDGMPLAERRLAEKIIDAGLLIPMGEMLAQEQFVQGAMAIERGMDPVMVEVREAAVKGLSDTYNVKELTMLAEFFASKQGDDIRNRLNAALEPSQVLMNERAQIAMVEALDKLKAAWPEPAPAAPPAPAGPPGLPPGLVPSN
jgi:hypothetical protein